jgi:hypothetical protein
VHQPPPAIRVSFSWLSVPGLKNMDDPCGIVKLSLLDISGMAVRRSRRRAQRPQLVCKVLACKQSFATKPARAIELPDGSPPGSPSGSPSGSPRSGGSPRSDGGSSFDFFGGELPSWDQMFIVKQAKRNETFTFEIYDEVIFARLLCHKEFHTKKLSSHDLEYTPT